MIITISGVPGSGKTSVGKILAEKLGYNFYSMGDLRGKMALERGMTIDQLNELGEKDHTTDTSVDEYQKELGQKEDNFVVEGRLSWNFIPHSFKIFLDCEPMEAARRVQASHRERPDEKISDDLSVIRAELDARIGSDLRRYSSIYNINHMDKSHYDLVMDTTESKSAEETAEKILAAIQK